MALFVEAGFRCSFARCDTGRPSIDIHHIDANPSHSRDPENLIVLCANHHRQVTAGLISADECRAAKAQLRDYSLNRPPGEVFFVQPVEFVEQVDASAAWEGRGIEARDIWSLDELPFAITLTESLLRSRFLAIADVPGSGKSALALMVARRIAITGASVMTFNSQLHGLVRSRSVNPLPGVLGALEHSQKDALLIVDDAQLAFRGRYAKNDLATVLAAVSTNPRLRVMLVYAIIPGQPTGMIALPHKPERVPDDQVRIAVYSYLKRHHADVPVQTTFAAAQAQNLTAWEFMALARGDHTAVADAHSRIERALLFQVCLPAYLHGQSAVARDVLEAVSAEPWRRLLEVPGVELTVAAKAALAHLVWDEGVLTHSEGVLRPLHSNHARRLLADLMAQSDLLAHEMADDFTGRLAATISTDKISSLETSFTTLPLDDKRELRWAAQSLGWNPAYVPAGKTDNADDFAHYGSQLTFISDALKLCPLTSETDAVAREIMRPINALLRRTVTTNRLYHFCIGLFFDGSTIPMLGPALLEHLDTVTLGRVLSKPETGADVMEIVIALDLMRGLERLRTAELMWLMSGRIHRLVTLMTTVARVQDQADEEPLLNAARAEVIAAMRAFEGVGVTQRATYAEVAGASALDLTILIGKMKRRRKGVKQALEVRRETVTEARDRLKSGELFLEGHMRAIEVVRGGWSATTELAPIGNLAQVSKAVDLYRQRFLDEFFASSISSRVFSKALDVQALQARVAEFHVSWTPILLRAIFTTNAAKASEFFALMSPEQRAAVGDRIKSTLSAKDFSPLHITPDSIPSLAFAGFVAKTDTELRTWLSTWITAQLEDKESWLVDLMSLVGKEMFADLELCLPLPET